MIKKNFIILIGLVFSQFAFGSEKPCANYAKYAAIRAYKAETGSIQGSDGLHVSAKWIKTQNQILDYAVRISDNNEDGETWDVDYWVQIQKMNSSCKILKVKKISHNE
jgi:hypothetical protein